MPFAYRSWLTSLQSKLPNALALLLALVCGALLARLVWQLWPQTHDSPTPMQATPAELADTSPSQAVNIANQHLFGVAPPRASVLKWRLLRSIIKKRFIELVIL